MNLNKLRSVVCYFNLIAALVSGWYAADFDLDPLLRLVFFLILFMNTFCFSKLLCEVLGV